MNSKLTKRGALTEEDYFAVIERERMEKVRSGVLHRRGITSPLSGKPMQQFTLEGVTIFKCDHSGGVWLGPESAAQLLPNLP